MWAGGTVQTAGLVGAEEQLLLRANRCHGVPIGGDKGELARLFARTRVGNVSNTFDRLDEQIGRASCRERV